MKRIGYTTGVYDLFHIGHVNLLRRARLECDFLIVGITTDELCIEAKGKAAIIPFTERMSVVERGAAIMAPPPNPMIAIPVAIPRRSGNQRMRVDTGVMYPRPRPVPPSTP